jgi:glycosyltransferase involved in cell wall biosynthesis
VKIAYLISLYPAVSHTFILAEVMALRARGLEVETFSVRRARPRDILGADAEAEAGRTRWLLPASLPGYARALLWALGSRPARLARTLATAVARRGLGLRNRVMWLIYLVEAVQLAHWLHRGGHQHLHVHFGNPASNTAWLAARLAGLPFSMTLHGIDLDEPERFRLPQKIAEARFTACISQFGRAKMLYATPPAVWNKVHLVRCGLAGAPPESSPPGDTGRLVCVARLSPEKGHLILLDALAALHRAGRSFHCTLVGDGPMRQELESRAAALGLDGRVSFAGAQPPAKVAGYYAEADAVVLASFGEGIPLVLMEAMSHGRPVIATWVGGIPELVVPGKTGWLVPPGSVDALREALEDWLSDPERARALGREGRAAVQRKHRIEVAAERLEALFRGGSPPSP